MGVIKERMVDIIDRQPEDSTDEEIFRELAFEKMILTVDCKILAGTEPFLMRS
jgi:hypothetical protein